MCVARIRGGETEARTDCNMLIILNLSSTRSSAIDPSVIAYEYAVSVVFRCAISLLLVSWSIQTFYTSTH